MSPSTRTWYLAAVLASLAVTSAQPGELPFREPVVVDSTLRLASSVTAADLDGDGDLDLAGTSVRDGRVLWWRNDGLAGPWKAETLVVGFAGATSARTADLDRDGRLDVVAASPDTGTVQVWFNRELGWHAEIVSVECDGAWELEVADLDGDSDGDLVVVAYCGWGGSGGTLAWLENPAPAAGLWERHVIAADFPCGRSVSTGDVDGDGDTDVLAGRSSGLSWWENPGDSGPWIEHGFGIPQSALVDEVALADLDGDGDLDVLAAIFLSGLWWWENLDGSGAAWSPAIEIGTAGGSTLSVGVADLDKDGDLDLVSNVTPYGADWVESAEGWVFHTLPGWVDELYEVSIADLDGDGDLDIAGADLLTGRVLLWESLLAVFADGFESGDTDTWSSATSTRRGRP